ncbi:MAG: hypothetical protein ACI9XO_004270 [Paraglaciecola sp.]|jgi:hypothetical protein
MKDLLFVIIALFLFSCDKKEDNGNEVLPQCIQDIIDDETMLSNLKTVRRQMVDGDFHYWLNTDEMHVDGSEGIINGDCEEVCNYCGECPYEVCIENYDFEGWEIVWEE